MRPEFTIYKADNGVMVEYPNPNGEGILHEVFENHRAEMKDYRLGELEMAEKVVWTLLEVMGWRYDKHKKHNLTIEIEEQS